MYLEKVRHTIFHILKETIIKNKGKKSYFIEYLLILSYTTIHRNQLFTTKFAKAIRASKVSFPDGII